MNLSLYYTNSVKNKVNKELTLLTETTFTDFLYDSEKNNISINNLQIEQITDKEIFNKVNYARLTINDITYSCFVKNTTFVNGLLSLTLHIDILSTFWNDIKELNCIVEVNEKRYNSFINNNSRVVSTKKYTDNVLFPNGFTNDYNYILNVAGHGGVTNE